MQELMPETWLRDKEENIRNTLSLPWRRTAPVTDILQWLQFFGVLSQKYSQMVPELMVYQVTIVKYSHDFEGLAWALYDLAYRRQVAQTKDLCWSCLNPTLFSLCLAGKARYNIGCTHNNHPLDNCPDNPSHSLFLWQHLGQTFLPVGVAAPVGGAHPFRLCICHLFSVKDGPKCMYNSCKFAHVCAACRANQWNETIHDLFVQKHNGHRHWQTQVERVECPSANVPDCRSSLLLKQLSWKGTGCA